MCVFVCVCVCVCVCVFTLHVCVYVCVDVCACTYIYMSCRMVIRKAMYIYCGVCIIIFTLPNRQL